MNFYLSIKLWHVQNNIELQLHSKANKNYKIVFANYFQLLSYHLKKKCLTIFLVYSKMECSVPTSIVSNVRKITIKIKNWFTSQVYYKLSSLSVLSFTYHIYRDPSDYFYNI